MDVSAYVLLSHEQALRRRLDVVANNMANVSTTGFRREQPVFQELVRQTAGIEPIRTATGLQAFRRSLALPHDQLLVVEGAKQKIAAYLQKALTTYEHSQCARLF